MGSDPEIKEITLEELHTDVLPSETQDAFRTAITLPFLKEKWYLAGGTALALQVGHRSSEDLDFSTEDKDFDIVNLERAVMNEGGWVTTQGYKGTLFGIFRGSKVSSIAYPFFRSSNQKLQCGTMRILPLDDIASMKIIVVSQRGKKRDFVDLYWYTKVHGASLSATIVRAIEQFPEKNHSMPHFIKSLTYFDDAEEDIMPKLYFKADWEEIKAYFRKEVPEVAKELLGIKD